MDRTIAIANEKTEAILLIGRKRHKEVTLNTPDTDQTTSHTKISWHYLRQRTHVPVPPSTSGAESEQDSKH